MKLRSLRAGLSRAAARVLASRFAKPIARVVVAAAGLLLLALVGRTAIAGALARSAPAAPSSESEAPPPAPTPTATPTAAATPTSTPTPTASDAPAARGPATSDDPVVLNTATADDLRRLPGIGEKRANAILALRTRLGRFRAIEDLLKVKGIGRSTLRRLRPLVRLDPPSIADGGAMPTAP